MIAVTSILAIDIIYLYSKFKKPKLGIFLELVYVMPKNRTILPIRVSLCSVQKMPADILN